MDLADWMTETGTSPETLADLVGVHLVTVYHWKAKRKMPRREHLRSLTILTDGRVGASDFVPRLVEPSGEAA